MIQLTLVYGLRYIMKLAVKATASSLTALKGQEVSFVTDGTHFVNIKQREVDTTYSLSWVCPGKLNNFCSQSKFINS